jgi:hypothetical protein
MAVAMHLELMAQELEVAIMYDPRLLQADKQVSVPEAGQVKSNGVND